jgi:acylphosphatase
MSETVTRHLSIHGRVHGVGFRNYLAYKAEQLHIGGWVRNRMDGSVEAVVHGAPAAVDTIIECARRGPRAAQVTAVVVSDHHGAYAAFEQRQTE